MLSWSRKCFFLTLAWMVSASLWSSRAEAAQSNEDIEYYSVEGLIYLRAFHQVNGVNLASTRIPEQKLEFRVLGDITADSTGKVVANGTQGGVGYTVIRFYSISASGDTYKGNALYVNSDDNDKLFALTSSDFSQLAQNGQIRKRTAVTWKPGLTFGAALSLPFKLRRHSSEHNRDITTDVSLGGYVGPRWRLHSTRQYFVSAVGTLGISLLPIHDDVTTDDTSTGTSTVPGLTFSFGAIIELESFQLGLMAGKDYASGDLGSTWIYNAEWWFSLSIGFKFIGGDVTPSTK
jgi:hypothetical protein